MENRKVLDICKYLLENSNSKTLNEMLGDRVDISGVYVQDIHNSLSLDDIITYTYDVRNKKMERMIVIMYNQELNTNGLNIENIMMDVSYIICCNYENYKLYSNNKNCKFKIFRNLSFSNHDGNLKYDEIFILKSLPPKLNF